MKRYYLVKAKYDNPRFPFRNQVVEALSEGHAVEKYLSFWRMKDGTEIDTDPLVSIEAEYLGISENFARMFSSVAGELQYFLFKPWAYISIILGMVFHYDPQMFKSAERRKDPYRTWVKVVSVLGWPLYWIRCLCGTRDKIWTDMEKESDKPN